MPSKNQRKEIARMRSDLIEFCKSGVYSCDINERCTNHYGEECPIFDYAKRGKDDSARYWCCFDNSFYDSQFSARNVREAHALLPLWFFRMGAQKRITNFS